MKILLSFLLILHRVSCFDSNIKKNGIKQLYNHILINSTFYEDFGNAWVDCIQKCKGIRKCKSINYIRGLGLCELNDADETTTPEALQTRVGATFTSKSDWNFQEPEYCDACSDKEFCSTGQEQQCEVFGCPAPPPVAGAVILGNLFNIGTKRLYRCSNGVKQVSVCQEDGNWSPVTITCTISEELELENATCPELEIDNANYTINETEDGIIEATFICESGYVHSGVNKIQCNNITWKWDNLEQARCMKMYVQPWTLVYRTISGASEGTHRSWRMHTRLSDGEFRNDEIMSEWRKVGIKQVKIDIINVLGNVVATLIFNGTGNTKASRYTWFSAKTLINSSWTDLETDTSVDIFSINGFDSAGFLNTGTYQKRIRWAILNRGETADGLTIDCSKNVVWLAVMDARYHPCDESIRKRNGRLIVFSNSDTGTRWSEGKLELAREMTVSVLLT